MARRGQREEPTHQPERVLTGRCPECGRVVVVFNNHEAWPLVYCFCGWHGPTDAVANYHRIDRRVPWENPPERGRLTRLEYMTALSETPEEHRHRLRTELDEDWNLIAMWCELSDTTQEEERP